MEELMRVFCAAKPAEFEAGLLEKGVRFDHPDDDPTLFGIADEDVDLVDEIARRLAIYVYIKDDYITEDDTFGDRY